MKLPSRPTLALVRIAVALVLVASSASAQRIVILRPKTADPALLQAFGRLKGELATYDFEVVVVDADGADTSPRQLARAAEQARAVASVSLVRSEGLATADVWISDRVTGKTTMRTIATSENREASSVLAVRAVDLLRTSLREFPAGEAPPPDVVGASPERAPPRVREWAEKPLSPHRWSIRAGAIFQSTLSGLGSLYGPSIALGYRPFDRVAFALGFQGPLSGPEASTGGASLTLRQQQTFAQVRYELIAETRWSLEACVSAGAHRLEVEGTAQPPYIGRSDSAWTALLAGGLAFDVALARNVGIVASGDALFLLPRPVVRAAGTEYAYGRPMLQGDLALRVSF